MESLIGLGEKGLFLLVAWLMAGGQELRGIVAVRQVARWSKYNAWEGIRALKGAGLVREVGAERFVLDLHEVKKFFTYSSSSIFNFDFDSLNPTPTRGKNFFANVAAFEAWKLQTHERVLRLADAEHVTPEYIERMCCNFFHHQGRAETETGMLLWRMEKNWVPEKALCPLCAGGIAETLDGGRRTADADRYKYIAGEFAQFVEH